MAKKNSKGGKISVDVRSNEAQALAAPLSGYPPSDALSPIIASQSPRMLSPTIETSETDLKELIQTQTTEKEIRSCSINIKGLPIPYEIFRKGLMDIGQCANSLSPIYRKISLPFLDIEEIEFLERFIHIFTLEIQGNRISNLNALKTMKFLVYLDASYNGLEGEFDVGGLTDNLHYLDVSRNAISRLENFGKLKNLRALSLDRNQLTDISELAGCKNLTVLSVAYNKIFNIDVLENLPLRTLDISNNFISDISILKQVSDLQELYANNNQIESIDELRNHPYLGTINLSNNQISDSGILDILNSMIMLRWLKICQNPLELNESVWTPKEETIIHPNATYLPSYRLFVVFKVQRLTILNSIPVIAEEKVGAINMYDAPPEVLASKQHMKHIINMSKAYIRIRAQDLLRAKRLCPVVLFGPNGAGKRTLANRLLQEFPHIYGLSVSHTTRKPRPGEEHGVHYWFSTKQEIEKLNNDGKFLQLVTLFGNTYGTCLESIDKVTEQGKVCVMALEYEGVLALKKEGFKAYYIHVTPSDLNVLEKRIAKRQNVKNMDFKQWMEKTKEFQKTEYDMTIVNDEIEAAYNTLRDYCLKKYYGNFEED